MKLKFTFYLMMMLFPAFVWSQKINEVDSYITPQYHQSITFKPINYSNINLGESDEMGFLQIGIQYERLLRNQRQISFVLPFTYTRYFTGFVTDYNKSGNQYYISPGIKYYLNDYNKLSGYAISAQVLLGYRKYNYSSQIVYNGKAKGSFVGLLLNNHYHLKLAEHFSLGAEWGIGIRYLHEKHIYVDRQDPLLSFDEKTDNRISGIMNVSFGINYRF